MIVPVLNNLNLKAIYFRLILLMYLSLSWDVLADYN